MYQHLYTKFLDGHKGKIHLAAHSHHFWPDVSLDGHTQYWIDAQNFSDHKWNVILGEKLSIAQKQIATILNLKHPEQLAFAPNTHELLSRLLSCFLEKGSLKVLTTDSEFHSFSRQIKRLEEFESVKVTYLDGNSDRFEKELIKESSKDYDLIFVSHVLFNSGKVIDINCIEKAVLNKPKETIFVLDGYHGFCAIPTDLSRLEDKIYYLGGGYKYAQAGEGMCFMSIPKDCHLRPVYTGWFASFSTLESSNKTIDYDNNSWRFWGATQDLSSLYRFQFVWNKFDELELNVLKIHEYIQVLQKFFIENFKARSSLISCDLSGVGHFLTLSFKTVSDAQKAHLLLLSKNIVTDFRGKNLRFGFGLYLTFEQIEIALKTLNSDEFLALIK